MFDSPEENTETRIAEDTNDLAIGLIKVAGMYLTSDGDLVLPADAAALSRNDRRTDRNGESRRTRGKSSNG